MKLSTVCAAACAAVALVVSGCGGDDGAEAPAADTVATADTAAPAETADTTAPAETDDTSAPAETPAALPVYVDGQAPAERTITIVEGVFEPAEITVAVGETVSFVTQEGIYGVIVGGLDGYTVTTGLYATFQFDAAGTYPVREDISGNTATIIVSG